MRLPRSRRSSAVGLGPALALALALPTPALAATPAGDATVAARLQARDIAYEVDADGDFKVTIGWRQEERSQLVFVAGKARGSEALSMRSVFAPAARVADAGLDEGVAVELLRESSRRPLGYWAIIDTHLFYVVDVDDTINAEGLDTVINLAAEIADDKEIELTGGKDEF